MGPHRAELPALEAGVGERAAVIAGGVAAVGLGVALALTLPWIGLGSVGTVMLVLGAPPWLYLAWLRRRRDRRVADASRVEPLEASRGRLTIGGRAMRATSAFYEDGMLRVDGPLGASHVTILATAAEARAIVDALDVPDDGLRTAYVAGPVASIPIVGDVAMFGAPLITASTLMVLAFASHLSLRATAAFVGLCAVSTVVSVLAIAPRRLRVAGGVVELRWLGRARSIPVITIESITLHRGAIVLRARGARPLRMPLLPIRSTGSFSLAELRARAARRAAEPIALASAHTVASVFE